MTTSIIIVFCILIIIAYIFDITSSDTKIPSVILLLLLGWLVQQLTDFMDITVPNLDSILPLLGTVGLIMIVLEGTLELDINLQKLSTLARAFFSASISLILFSFILAYFFHFVSGYSFKLCLINAIPLSVISSSIAIPSARNLGIEIREFVTYESSLSDIVGVILFNFFALNEVVDFSAVLHFGEEFIYIILLSFAATAALAFLLSKIQHHVKFAPIIFLIILIYTVAKHFHLPALIFVLVLGLFLGNFDIAGENRFIKLLKPEILKKEVHKFKELVTEATFLVRSIFFILFGFSMKTSEILDTNTLGWAAGIVSLIFAIRAIQLYVTKMDMLPYLFIAPRGLITILLFLAIPSTYLMPLMSISLVIQIVIFTALFMMLGMIFKKKNEAGEVTVS